MTEHEQLTQLCERLGAPRAQAAIMASQLMKRADQLAAERGLAREVAMKELLEIVVKGRAGEVPEIFAARKAKEGAEKGAGSRADHP